MDLNRKYPDDYVPEEVVLHAATLGISARELLIAKRAVMVERERCAKIVEQLGDGTVIRCIAAEIRKGE